jgi:hypothetical protein
MPDEQNICQKRKETHAPKTLYQRKKHNSLSGSFRPVPEWAIWRAELFSGPKADISAGRCLKLLLSAALSDISGWEFLGDLTIESDFLLEEIRDTSVGSCRTTSKRRAGGADASRGEGVD